MKFVVAFVTLFVISACWSDDHPTGTIEARTAIVLDGDSLIAKRGRNELEIRLYGIDAPEKTQPWSEDARKGLEKLIAGRMLLIQPVERDRYDRIVARVYRSSDDMYVNAEMIRRGHAWAYRRYTSERELLSAEKRARDSNTGLWQLPEQQRQPPWQWRTENNE